MRAAKLPPPIDLDNFDASAFRVWMERLGAALGGEPLTYKRTAELLGISERVAKYYAGKRTPPAGRSGVIPKTVAFTCEALEVRAVRRMLL